MSQIAKATKTGLYFNGTNFSASRENARLLPPSVTVEQFALVWSTPVQLEPAPAPMKPQDLAKLISLLSQAKAAEAQGNLPARNALALEIFENRKFRKIEHEGSKIETWWDSRSRNFITQKETPEFTLGESDYTGNKHDASVSHFWALCPLFLPTAKR